MALVVLNFKAYKEATGESAVKLARIAKEVSQEANVRIIVAPQAPDICKTSPIIETFAQHIDPFEPGAQTGYMLAEAVLSAGAVGSILNHAEHKMPLQDIEKTIKKLHSLGMKSLVCAKDTEEAKQVAVFNPDYIAVEPPELIGSGVSVSTAKPEVVKDTVAAIKNINKKIIILCGAGVSNGADGKKAKKLGVEGVLLASAFVKAVDPKTLLLDIAEGVK